MNDLKSKLIDAIKKKTWIIRNCSLCDYPLRFSYYNNQLYFDSGCRCTMSENIQERQESELDLYLNPESGWIEEIEKFVKESGND